MKSGELAKDFTPSFKHAHHSGSFSAQTHVHNSNKSRSSRVQQTEAESGVLTPLQRSRDHVYSALTQSSAFIISNSPDIFVSVFYVCVTDVSPSVDFFASVVCWQPNQPACSESSGRSPAVFTHRLILDFYGLYTGGVTLVKSSETREPLTWTFAFTHAPPPEKIQSKVMSRNYDVYFIKQSYRNVNIHVFEWQVMQKLRSSTFLSALFCPRCPCVSTLLLQQTGTIYTNYGIWVVYDITS